MDNRLTEDRQHNALKDQWAYDSLYRVVDQKRDVPDAGGNPAEERAWTLDGPGNWTSLGITTPLATTTLTQGLNTLNSYTSFGGVAQADDLDGNRIDDGRFLYKWDFLHRLREVHCKTGGELIATYLCDAYGANGMLNGSGRRVRKTVSADKHGCSGTFEALKETDEMPGDSEDANDPGAEKAFAKRKASDIRYLYDGMACVEERDGTTDKVLRQYVNGSRVNEHLTMDLYKSDGVKLKGTLFYHEDAKGWIVALTDKTGKLKERVSYDAFGLPRFENAKGKASGNQTQSKFGNPYLYGGSYFDLETRLFCMGHRFYSPAEGRFISRDPIGIWGARGSRGNPYVYIGVNGWDPEGLDGFWSRLGRGIIEPATATADVLRLGGYALWRGERMPAQEFHAWSMTGEAASTLRAAGEGWVQTGFRTTPGLSSGYELGSGLRTGNPRQALRGTVRAGLDIGLAALAQAGGDVNINPEAIPWRFGTLPKNVAGRTFSSGEVILSEDIVAGSAQYFEVLGHESFHFGLTPSGFGAGIRATIGQWAYENIQFVRYLEEALAQTKGTGSLIQGLRFPLAIPEYELTLSGVASQGVLYGGGVWGAFYWGQQHSPFQPCE